METVLYLSIPDSVDYQVYREDESSEFSFCFAPFDSTLEPISLNVSPSVEQNKFEGLELLNADGIKAYPQKEYVLMISKTIQKIKDEDWGKVVISRPYFKEGKLDVLKNYEQLVKAYPQACVYLFYHKACGLWMGATPETLLRGKEGKLKTMSLAGTIEKGQNQKLEHKEIHEQALVTTFIKETLAEQKGISQVNVGDKSVLKAGNLKHFVNPITAHYTSLLNTEKVLNKLHPTPAVGAYPAQALSYIGTIEKHKRLYYAGYFGLSSSIGFDYFVNLRCMQVFNNGVVLYAGGGITASSNPTKEWEETEAKMRTLLNVLTFE